MTRIGAVGLLCGILLVNGCSDSEATGGSNAPSVRPPSRPSSGAAVELSADQLKAIQIQAASLYSFPMDKEAIGNIDFDEDLAVVQAESTLVGAAATYALSDKALARLKDLSGDGGGVSQRELEQAILDHETAAGALKAARATVRALGKSDAQIDAIVRSHQIGAAPSTIKWAVASVTESDTPSIRAGQAVAVRVTAHPERVFQAKVTNVYAVIDPNTHRSKARCEIVDPNNELRPGMLASLVIRVRDPVQSVAIAEDAVVREGDGSMTVWMTSDRHRFTQTIVKTGLRRDGRVQIVEGLQAGDLVVAEGSVFLSNLLQAPPTD
jgi:membrane fusion protein, heavy metal efflux system